MVRRPQQRLDRDWRDYDHPAMSYKPPKELRRFRASMVLLVSTLVVAGLWTAVWFATSHYVTKQVIRWADDQVAQGSTAAFETLDISGFPSRIIMTMAKPHFDGVVFDERVAWRGEHVTITTRPWAPWKLHVEAPGRHELSIGEGLNVKGKVETLSTDIVTGSELPEELTLNLAGVDLRGDTQVVMDALRVNLKHDAEITASGEGLSIELTGTNFTLPLRGGWGLGNNIANIEALLKVNGPVKLGALFDRLTTWRDVGGRVNVERLKLRAGPLAIAAAGTVALDDNLQPVATLSAKIEGLFQVLSIMRKQGVVRDGDAVLATMVLSALSKRPPGGGKSSINLAVNITDGKLMLGPVPVLSVPEIKWEQAPIASKSAHTAPPKRDYKNIAPVL